MATQETRKRNIQDIEILAHWLDSRFTGPFGIKFGIDSIIGLIPGFGDLLTTFMSSYVVLRAAALDVPRIVLVKMGINIIIDQLIGSIPIIGDLFDIGWKANQRNYNLMRAYPSASKEVVVKSWIDISLIAIILISIFLIPIFIFVLILKAIF